MPVSRYSAFIVRLTKDIFFHTKRNPRLARDMPGYGSFGARFVCAITVSQFQHTTHPALCTETYLNGVFCMGQAEARKQKSMLSKQIKYMPSFAFTRLLSYNVKRLEGRRRA